jgi:hypothetical protein
VDHACSYVQKYFYYGFISVILKLHYTPLELNVIPVQAWTGLYNYRTLRVPEFSHYRHMQVKRMSAQRTDRFCTQNISVVLISVKG